MRLLHLLRRTAPFRPWRRRHDREATRLEATWHLFGSAVHRVTTTADVSEGGLFLCSAAPLEIGSPLVIELSLPRGVVEVHGRVAWTDARGMGVRLARRLEVGVA